MTLTRGPCELEKMSLFQDLKLKRRKIDSRCSSDSESVADTSTSSPDVISSSSQKMSDATQHPPSPDSTPHRLHAAESTMEKVFCRVGESGVFDGGGTSVIKTLPVIRSQSPPLRPATTSSLSILPPRPHSLPGRPSNSPVIKHNPLLLQLPVSSTNIFPQAVTCQDSGLSSSSAPIHKYRGVIISQPQANQNQLWLKHSRINGVKPEIIGGNMNTTAADPNSINSAMKNNNCRQTPTVIMGEAGGVRTMIWSQSQTPLGSPLPESSQNQAPTVSWTSTASSVTNTEENAAQMLLNLGQEKLSLPNRSMIPPPPLSPSHSSSSPLNMEKLWAGDLRQLPSNQQMYALNLSTPLGVSSNLFGMSTPEMKFGLNESSSSSEMQMSTEEEDQPMICMICEDKATGLHYGIITCEGCKGFFKRTVQNRRVYTCVADGNCEITKAQRNRCQYCRFKKCIEQGMVLQAVREDRMPGGRNSGAVYNLYKVKYKKHKKPTCKQSVQKILGKSIVECQQMKNDQPPSIPANLVNGTILKTALTNPSEVIRLRQRLDSAVSSSKDKYFSIEYSLSMIKTLMDCDEFQDIATLQLDEILGHNTDLGKKLCHIGDSIVYKLVQWTKRLPFYLELPVDIHTNILTNKWHELLVLTTSAYQAIHKSPSSMDTVKPDFNLEVESNLCTLQCCLTSMMGREITIEQLRHDVGLMIEKITHVTMMFRQIKLTMEEYVCLKVITMLNQDKPTDSVGSTELETVHERYMTCLRVYTQHIHPQQTNRFQDLLGRLPEVQSAASLLLESKMFYVPFLLNSAIQR
uniref:HR4X1 n=1 Tax=Henosepilachna vigintioctopunctata TaxID=420089 RepID=A0A9E9NIE8_9CUCU|nr:HR4X1 [Henosepilachna vigintioctopunctata]